MSWLNLSNNLSNLSGNFSTITGQISNFTREVLTEGTEEAFDQNTELKLSHIKIKDLENALQKQKDEVDRINYLNEELRDRSVSAELQIQALSDEYRAVIEGKEKEIKELKSSQVDLRHGISASQKDESFARDGMEFEDPEFFQMTISKLKNELEGVKSECEQWKEAAKNQNNQAELQQLKDYHQQEIASLQSTYSQRIAQMNKKHQSELEDLVNENEKLINDIKDYESASFDADKNTDRNSTPSKELEEKCKKLSIDYAIKKKQLESLQTQILEEKRLRKIVEEGNASLKEEMKNRNEKIIELEAEVEALLSNQVEKEKSVSFDTNEREKLEELDRMWRTKFDGILQDLNEVKDENVAITLEISQAEEKYAQLKTEKEDLLRMLDDLGKENEKLKIEKSNLQENVNELEKLRGDILRLGNCTSDLLEELEFQKGLSEEQILEIESLRKICTIKGSPAEEIKKMQKSLKELGRRYVELHRHYQKVSLELRKSNDRLRAERQLRHNSTSQLRKEISSVQQRFQQNVDSKLNAHRADSENIHSQLSNVDLQLDERARIVTELQIDSEYATEDVAQAVSLLGSKVDDHEKSKHAESKNDTIESLIAEKCILERTIEGLERKVGSLEAIVATQQEDNSTIDGTASPSRTSDNSPRDSDAEPDRKMRKLDLDAGDKEAVNEEVRAAVRMLRPFSMTDAPADGYFFDEEQPQDSKMWVQKEPEAVSREEKLIHKLEEKLLIQEKELNEMNIMTNDLEFEKTTLEKVVMDLQRKLKAKVKANDKESSFVDVRHQESETDVSSLDWDNLIEAKEERKALIEELEQVKSDFQLVQNDIDVLISFLVERKEIIVLEADGCRAKNSERPIEKLGRIIRFYVSEVSSEALKYQKETDDLQERLSEYEQQTQQLNTENVNMSNEFQNVTSSLSRARELGMVVWKLVAEARNRKVGEHNEILDEGQSCEDVLKDLHCIVENFVLESSGETDADKWRMRHGEVLSERDVLLQDLSNVRNEIRIWKEKHRDVVDENTSLLETIDMLRQDLEFMSQGQSALTAEREQLQTELDKLQFQIDTNETDDSKEIGELKMQLDDLKMEKERIMKMVNDRDDFIVEQQEKHDSLVYQLMEEKDRDLQEIQGQLEQTMTLFKEKQEECTQLLAQLASLEEENALISEVNSSMEKDLNKTSRKLEKLERELSEKMQKAIEKEVMIKSLEEEDEELREKEMIEEDLLREQEILVQDLRNENEYLRDELNAKELLIKKMNERKVVLDGNQQKEDAIRELKEISTQVGLTEDIKEGDDHGRKKDMEKEKENIVRKNEELVKEIASHKKLIETLERRVFEIEGNRIARRSPTIQDNNVLDKGEEGGRHDDERTETSEDQVILKREQGEKVETRLDIEEPSQSMETQALEGNEVSLEEKRLVEDFVRSQDRIRELELEVDVYKKFEIMFDEKEIEGERLKSEVARMMQVLRSKDELLLNLQMMEEEGNSDAPFSSRARVIQYIRDKDSEIENMHEKCRTLEELAKHHSSQLELLKVERQNLVLFLRQKEAEAVDLNERLENIEARSVAKEHASTVLHAEHQKLMELNNSQGSEIARLRERNQYLQNILQERQNHSANEKMVNKRNEELEIQIAAFQQEQERLLTLIHEKDNLNLGLRKKLELQESNVDHQGEPTKDQNSAQAKIGLVDKSNDRTNQHEDPKLPKVQKEVEDNSQTIRDGLHTYELEINNLKEKLRLISETNSKLLSDNDELKQKLDLNDNEKRKLRSQMENENHEKSIEIKDFQINMNDLEKRIVDMTRNFELERSKISQHFETRTRLLIQEWEEKVRLKDQEIKSLLEKTELLQSVQEQVKKSRTLENGNVAETERLSLENKKLHSLYEDKKNEISILQGDIHKLKNVSSAREAALNKMQTDNKYLIEEGNKKENVIEDLEKRKTFAEQKIQELETEIHRLKVNSREIEAKAAKDVERLRNHLIEIEEGYTNEAVASQERERSLEQKLHEIQGMYQTRNTEFQETSNQSHFQIQNLQQQLFSIANQRDNAVSKLSQVQERAHQTETALNNLQLVLERLQREKDSQYEMLEEDSRKKLIRATREIEDLKKKEETFQARIQEATLAVQGVANLSKEMETKEHLINTLKKEVHVLQEDLDTKKEIVRQLKDSTEGKIEKPLMKNLLLGYFHTPEKKRPEVVRILGNLIGFSKEEIDEVGNGAPPVQRTWVASLIPFGAAPKPASRTFQRSDSKVSSSFPKSFTEMFVSFLEEESAGGNKENRPTTNQLTALLMESPKSFSTPLPGRSKADRQAESAVPSTVVSNPLLVTPQDAKELHTAGFKTSLPLLTANASSISAPLFPAPGQEIPRVHTSTANSALRTMLAK